jgi:hypothetical protein
MYSFEKNGPYIFEKGKTNVKKEKKIVRERTNLGSELNWAYSDTHRPTLASSTHAACLTTTPNLLCCQHTAAVSR